MSKGTRWTQEEYEQYLRRHSKAISDTKTGSVAQAAKHQLPVQSGTDGKVPGTPGDTAGYAVSIKSRRVRLIDPDNLVGGAKYFIDSLRIAGLIPDDSPEQITLTVTQEKVSETKWENTEIVIERI